MVSGKKDPTTIAHKPAPQPNIDRRRKLMRFFRHDESPIHKARGNASGFSIADIYSTFLSCVPGDGCVELKFQNEMRVRISVPEGASICTNSSPTPVDGAKGLADAITCSCEGKTVVMIASDKGVNDGTVLSMITQEDPHLILRSDKRVTFKVES